MSSKLNKDNSKVPKSSKWPVSLVILFVSILVIIFVTQFLPDPKTITWKEFETTMLKRKAVDSLVVINKNVASVYLKKEFVNDSIFKSPFRTKVGPHFTFNIGSVDSFERKLEEAQKDFSDSEKVEVIYEEKVLWGNILAWLLPLLFLFFIFRILSRSYGAGEGNSSAFSFGRSTARLLEKDNINMITFDQVAGLEEAKQEVKEIVDFLKSSTIYTKLGAKIPKGVIIVGPPGTGKTLLAKAVAGTAKVPFFSLSGSEFVEMFVGVGASRVRDLFKKAKEKAPCIVFIDEIDAVGRSRGKNALYTGANDERESTLGQLLTEMDGFGTNSGVIVLAATNRADILDPALLRPGRFDRHIYLELPNLVERREIFKVHIIPLKVEAGIDVDFLASQTPGFSGADIANICNEAALIAARKKKQKIEAQDFLDALDRIVAGLEKKSKIITKDEKKIISYHEAGHAIASWLLEFIDPLVKVSIIPRGKTLGAAWYLPEERQIRSYSYFYQRLTATLAGRAAEEIIFGEYSSGAIDDLEKVTKDAYAMIAYFGFNKRVGNVSFYDSGSTSEVKLQKPYSEETGSLIDEEVRKLVDECFQKAVALLRSHRQQLIEIAELLLEKEVVFKEEIEKILGKRTLQKPGGLIVDDEKKLQLK